MTLEERIAMLENRVAILEGRQVTPVYPPIIDTPTLLTGDWTV